MHKPSFYSYAVAALWSSPYLPLSLAQTTCATYCSNYDQILVNCRDLYSAGVDGSGAISVGAVNCMCIGTESFTGYYEMSKCYQCGLLTGNNAIVNLAWVETCYTNQFLGSQAAANCWNDNLVADVQVNSIGPSCYHTEAGSASASATPVAVGPSESVNTAPAAVTSSVQSSEATTTLATSEATSLSENSKTTPTATKSVLLTTTALVSGSVASTAPTATVTVAKSEGSGRGFVFSGVLGGFGMVVLFLVV